MRLIFLGSPAAVVAPLQTLLSAGPDHGHTVVGVVSQPARPTGRSQTMAEPPVSAYAKSVGLPTLQPEKASDPAFLAAFSALAPDVAITAAFGQILPDAFLQIPTRGTINIHPSLLPKYRGATPVPAALLEGEAISGVTVLFTVKKLDAGNIILQERMPFAVHETAGEFTERAFIESGALVLKALELLADPQFIGTPQEDRYVTHCRKIEKNDGLVDWTLAAEDIYNQFRAYEPWPGSYTFLAGRRLSIVNLKPSPTNLSGLAPGEATLDKRQHCLTVGTGEGTLQLMKLKPSGGKEILAEAFWNGLKERSRVVFGDESSGT